MGEGGEVGGGVWGEGGQGRRGWENAEGVFQTQLGVCEVVFFVSRRTG